MDDGRIISVVSQLAAAEPGACDRDGLAELVAASRLLRGFLDALDVRIGVRASQLAEEGKSESAFGLLSDEGRRAPAEARTAAGRARVCDRHEEFHDALADGEISGGHIDAFARAERNLDKAAKAAFDDHAPDLLTKAKGMPVDLFARECERVARRASADDGVTCLERLRAQRSVSRRVDRATGMCVTDIRLDPEADAKVWTAINAAINNRPADPSDTVVPWAHRAADAVVDLIIGARTVHPRVPEVSVLIDLDTLTGRAHRHGIVCELADGTPMPVAMVRRLSCDAHIVPITLAADGTVLDVGRSSRLATVAQRQALRAMYATCAYPGCQVAFEHCQIHHVVDWTMQFGPTDLANLLPLCSTHHHLVHEGGWRLELRPDRTITLTRPDGATHYHGTSVNRQRPPPRAA